MASLIDRMRPLYVDHVAVTTAVFEETVRDYLAMPGARIQRGPGHNPSQRVRFCFVRLDGGLVVEVLGLPVDGASPIEGHVAHGGGAYHICYAVADLEQAIAAASDAGARLVVPAKPDPAHDGRPVAFLMHPAHGLFELVAAYPAELSAGEEAPLRDVAAERPAASRSAPAAGSAALDTELVAAFRRVLPKLDEAQIRGARIGVTAGWDSLAQLQLTMEVERRLGIRIPIRVVETLDSFEAFKAHAARATA